MLRLWQRNWCLTAIGNLTRAISPVFLLFEMCVNLCLVQHIQYQFKKEEIEFPIIHRINSVFRRATNKWKVKFKVRPFKAFVVLVIDSHRGALLQDDVQLWLSHIAFCKKWVSKV